MSLLEGSPRVALALHKARCGTPFGVTRALHGVRRLPGGCQAVARRLLAMGSCPSVVARRLRGGCHLACEPGRVERQCRVRSGYHGRPRGVSRHHSVHFITNQSFAFY